MQEYWLTSRHRESSNTRTQKRR